MVKYVNANGWLLPSAEVKKGERMKKTVVKAVFLFSVVIGLIFSALSVGAVAEEAHDYQQINNKYASERIDLLNRRYDEHYAKKLEDDPNNVEGATYKVLQKYINKIASLKTDERMRTEDMTSEIELIYQKGIAAATLSWIYYSHNELTDVQEIRSVYEYQYSAINKATDSAFFDGAGAEDCFTLLLKSIYVHKIRALLTESDSSDVTTIIDAACLTIDDYCSFLDGGEDGGSYKEYFDRVRGNVENQRSRDVANDGLAKIFSYLYPEESYADSERLINFRNQLGKGSDTREINLLILRTVNELVLGLSEGREEHGRAYLVSLCDLVSEYIERENSLPEPSIADPSFIFEGHETKIYIADLKDELCDYAEKSAVDGEYTSAQLGELYGILLEYTSEGGFFDSASGRDEADALLSRGRLRCDWLAMFFDAAGRISFLSGDFGEVVYRAREYYAATDRDIRDGKTRELTRDIAVMERFVDEARAVEFLYIYGEIIEKENVSRSDLGALSLAVNAAGKLCEGAASFLGDSFAMLANRYVAASADAIKELFSSDSTAELRRHAVTRLSEELSALTYDRNSGAEGLSELAAACDLIVLRSESIDDLMTAYAEEYLTSSGRTFSVQAEGCVRDAVELIIADAQGGENCLAAAVTTLCRYSALEKLYKAAEGHTSVDGVEGTLVRAKYEIELVESREEIYSYAESTAAHIAELIRIDGIGRAKAELAALSDRLITDVCALRYIFSERKADFVDDLRATVAEGASALEAATDLSDVESICEKYSARLRDLWGVCYGEECTECLNSARASLNAFLSAKDDYSEAELATLYAIFDEYEGLLSGASDVTECELIRDGGLLKMREVETLIAKAKREARETLLAEYSALISQKELYSETDLSRLTEIYEHTLAELNAFVNREDVETVRSLTEERIGLMRGVPVRVLYTDGTELIRPDGYDPERDGYIGSVTSGTGLFYDMELSMNAAERDGVLSVIKKAAKKKLVFYGEGTKVESYLLRLLKKGELVAAFDISFGESQPERGASYTVSVLLPDGTEGSGIVGVVFLTDDGRLEFYPVKVEDGVLEFTTTHFSSYYVVGRGNTDLVPVMICVGIILLSELCALCILLYRKRRREEDEEASGALYGMLPHFALAAGYKPEGGVFALVVMSALSLALAGWIGYLLYLEANANVRRKKTRRLPRKKADTVSDASGIENTREPEPACVPSDRSGDSKKYSEDDEPCMAVATHTLSSVTAEQVETISEQMELRCEYDTEYVDREVYFGARRATVNLDTVCAAFNAGDTVTLNALKEKKLIQKNVGHIKILARGRMDKPLTVVAQDFSSAAVKMIVITGGRAVRTYPSAEIFDDRR